MKSLVLLHVGLTMQVKLLPLLLLLHNQHRSPAAVEGDVTAIDARFSECVIIQICAAASAVCSFYVSPSIGQTISDV